MKNVYIHEDKKYLISDEKPQDGDLVLTEKYGVWEYKEAPCPMPYWGNPNVCKKLIPIEENGKNQ